jgi:hypothetical protein
MDSNKEIDNSGKTVKNHDGKYYDRTKSDKYKFKSDKYKGINLKKCAKCKKLLPATPEKFYRDKSTYDGLVLICKKCKKETYQKKMKEKKEKNKVVEIIAPDAPAPDINNYERANLIINLDDTDRLLNFANNFLNFLESNPKIGFNLHDTIREIQEHFKFIQTKIS